MKLRNGIYWADFRLPSGERVRKTLKTRDKATAAAKERELIVELERELLEGPRKAPSSPAKALSQPWNTITLIQAFKRTWREHEPWRASTAPRTIEENFEKVADYFGARTPLHEITDEALLDYSEALRGKELAPGTINQRLSLISIIFKRARTWREFTGTLHRPEIIRQKPRKGRKRRITLEEETKAIGLLKQGIKPRHLDMADLVAVLVDSGLRLSEALRMADRKLGVREEALKKARGEGPGRGFTEVDLERRVLVVWDAKADNPAGVPMTDRVHLILEARKDLGRPFGMLTVDQADDCWEWVRKAMGLEHDKEFVIHALRHTTASRLVQAGHDTARVQRYMRHKNIATTMGYIHLEVEDLRDLSGTLGSVPRIVPKEAELGTIGEACGPPERGPSSGSRPDERTGEPVSPGLLIRRSLVRAQVGEPDHTGLPGEAPESEPEHCAQDCAQSEV